MSKRAVVTGAAGFVGSALSKRLHEEGWDLLLVDDLSTGSLTLLQPELQEKIWLRGFADPDFLSRLKDWSPDVVFHLAAIARVAISIEKPTETAKVNVLDTIKLFEACREGDVGRIVFASSSSVYGEVTEDDLPLTEGRQKRPKSPYALQKAFIEDYSRICRDLYGQDIICLRYFNVFGPGQLANGAYSTVIPSWCSAIKENRPLRLDGDGKQSRDMAFIDNVVDANIKAAEMMGIDPIINIAGGNRIVLNDILQWFKDRFDVTVENAPERPGDIKHTECAIGQSWWRLGYSPKVDFWDGLEQTVKWWDLVEKK